MVGTKLGTSLATSNRGPLVQQVPVLATGLHGIDHESIATVERHDHHFEQSPSSVEPEQELLCRRIIIRLAHVRHLLHGMVDVSLTDPVSQR